ncbi:MAG: hypothetical protein ACRDMX_15745, partial [Solirubrobacteraceae bacterium]
WTSITGATGTTYQPVVADEGDELHLLVTAVNPDGTVSQASAPTAAVTATPPSNTVAPPVSGDAVRGGTLMADDGTWLGVDNSYSDQWQRSTDGGTTWTDVGGATQAAYPISAADEGSELRVRVTATNPDATVSATSVPTSRVPQSPPVSTVAPTLSGTAQRGYLLTAGPGNWGGIGNTLAYEWQRSTDSGSTWSDIDGATASVYTLTVGDEGAILRVLVTASNADGTASRPSAATGTVGASPPVDTGLPSATGIARRGSSLSGGAGTWSGTGDTLVLQWQRSADGTTWTNISGATNQLYTLEAADEGDEVRLLVTASNPDASVQAASPATVAITGAPPVNTTPPAISGTPQRTFTLNLTSGSWGGVGNVLAFQWQRSADGGSSWTDIAGATSSGYTLALADEGDNVRAVVTAVNVDGTVPAVSAATAAVAQSPPINKAVPQVTGKTALGQTLSTDGGSWTPGGATLSYQWQHGNAADGYSSISGATAASYTTVSGDVGDDMRVIVTATNPDGSASATSAPTPAVQQPPVNVTSPAAPSGTLENGYTLTPDNGTWDAAASYTYTWLRCPGSATTVTAACASISNAGGYLLTVNDVNFKIAVAVTATTVGGFTTVDSALTGIVSGQPLTDTVPPSISGNPQPPNTLYANPGTWSVPLSTANYQWERCGADGVSGCTVVAADVAHYALTGADAGHTIVLIADVTSPGRAGTAQGPPLTIEAQPLPQASVMPTVSGTPTRTHTLIADGGRWTNSPTSLAYQWERCNGAGASCAAIPGATQVSYVLTAADEGFEVTIAVTAANSAGATTALGIPTAVVGGLLPVATQSPELSSLGVQQGTPVSVSPASWRTTAGTTYTTQWMRCDAGGGSCAAIADATAFSYTPRAADVSSTLRAVITATDVDGSVASMSQLSDVVLPAAPRWKALPILSTTGGAVGDTLTITPGVWSGPAVTSDAIEVMRCTSSCVSVASGTSYTIASGDVGSVMRVRETASNAGGAAVVWSAQYVGPVGSAGAGSVVMSSGRAILRGDTGTELAVARVATSATFAADALVAPFVRGRHRRARAGGGTRRLTLRRAPGLHGTLRVWVCSVLPRSARGGGGAPPPCTRQVTLRRTARSLRLALPPTMTGRVRVVVVSRRR